MTFRLAIVGAGAIAGAHAQAIAGLDGVELVAVVDVDQRAAAGLAASDADAGATVAVLASHEQLTGIDGAIVCTPPSTHEAITTDLLDSGIPVLCEKPLSIGGEAARRMIAVADDAGLPLVMASKFRYVDDVARARDLIAAGVIGEPITFENAFTGKVDMRGRWNGDPAVSGGGVLIDNGTHSVDIARFLFGPVTEVLAVEATRHQSLPVEDTALLVLRCEAGATGTVDLSWSIDKRLDDYVRVHGSEGTIRLGWRTASVLRAGTKDWEVIGAGYDKVAAFRAVVADFATAVAGGAPRITTADALASVLVIDAAHRSLAATAWEQVAPEQPALLS